MAGWDEQPAELEAEFPGWHVWRSNAGRWWATRTGAVLRREDLGTGRVMTVDADDPNSLRRQLLAQAMLDREVSGLTSYRPGALTRSEDVIGYGLCVDKGYKLEHPSTRKHTHQRSEYRE